MSDNLSPLNELKFKEIIQVTDNPAFTCKKSVSNTEVAFSLTFSYNFLKQLDQAVNRFSFSYVTILNSQVDICQIIETDRINNRFRDLCYKVVSELRQLKGEHRKRTLQKRKIVTIFKSELLYMRNQQCFLDEINEANIKLEKKCADLTGKITNENELTRIISDQNLDIHTLEQKNAYLSEYIRQLEEQLPKLKGEKDIQRMTPKTRYRTLKTLESEAQKALWFAQTFGLTPKSLTFATQEGKDVCLNFKENPINCDYLSMSNEDKEKVRKLVFLLDRFCVSDAAYHELSMTINEIPRSYLLVQCKKEMDKMVEIERLPGNVPGAMINVESEVQKLLARHLVDHGDMKNVKIKFSGDGAKVSRISNFVIFSISNVTTDTKLSFHEQQTIAIVECSENYENLKRCCKPIFDQLNCVMSKHIWNINGKELNVSFFICADMKFIQLLLGLGASTGEYACPWCKVDKEGRSNLSQQWDYFHVKTDICRNIVDMLDVNARSKNTYGCKHMPLVDLPVNHFIPDELHLMLRITDVLLRNLIDEAKEMDSDSKVLKSSPIFLKKLTELIQNCGVTFNVWKNKAGKFEWTSLSGSEKIKLLNHLPSQLVNQNVVLFENLKNDVIQLWVDFYDLYKYINSTTDKGEDIFTKAKAWLQDFLNIGKKHRKGYNLHNVTPYMHCLVYHVPYFASHFGPLKSFSGQGVEKNNDVIKQIHQKKSNKWDSAVSALVTRKRLEFGYSHNLEREKRSYEKKSQWWENELKLSRSLKRKEIQNDIAKADEKCNAAVAFDNMTDQELRSLLKSYGISTKVRNRDKLMHLISSLNL